MSAALSLEQVIGVEYAGRRVDQVAAALLPEYSRECIQKWIKAGSVLLDGKTVKPKNKVLGGELLTIEVNELPTEVTHTAEPIDLNIVHEDDSVLLINKPAGLVVHPGAGNQSGTLLNALLYHCPDLETVPRAGIVHRIDKETTGLLVVAKTLPAHTSLVRQLQEKTMTREYYAIVNGVMTGGGKVDLPIGRHKQQRVKMAVVPGGKEAVTHYRVVDRYRGHTQIRVQLETGRTHQIRVHMAHIRYPLIGDPAYGGRFQRPKGCTEELFESLRGLRRQALHAAKLGFDHPETGEYCEWSTPLPEDMQEIIAVLEMDLKHDAD